MSDSANDVPHADWIVEQLESLPFVEWDRFTVNNFDNGVMLLNVYGWIDRPDDHEDFVLLQVYPKKPDVWGYITSSDEYTEEIYEILFDEEPDGHNPCRRVEHTLDVDNCVRLTEQSSLEVSR